MFDFLRIFEISYCRAHGVAFFKQQVDAMFGDVAGGSGDEDERFGGHFVLIGGGIVSEKFGGFEEYGKAGENQSRNCVR